MNKPNIESLNELSNKSDLATHRGRLIYVILSNSLFLLSCYLLFWNWYSFAFIVLVLVGGTFYELNRCFYSHWIWKGIFWILVLHFMFLVFMLGEVVIASPPLDAMVDIKNGSQLDFEISLSYLLFIEIFIATFYLPNTYFIFKYAYYGKAKWVRLLSGFSASCLLLLGASGPFIM